jgi:hypothetical protein
VGVGLEPGGVGRVEADDGRRAGLGGRNEVAELVELLEAEPRVEEGGGHLRHALARPPRAVRVDVEPQVGHVDGHGHLVAVLDHLERARGLGHVDRHRLEELRDHGGLEGLGRGVLGQGQAQDGQARQDREALRQAHAVAQLQCALDAAEEAHATLGRSARRGWARAGLPGRPRRRPAPRRR